MYQNETALISLCISPNDKFLFGTFKDKKIKVWNEIEHQKIFEIEFESIPNHIQCFKLQPIVIISSINVLKIFRIENPFEMVEIGSIRTEKKNFGPFLINEIDNEIIIGSYTGEIYIYDSTTFELKNTFFKYNLPIYTMNSFNGHQIMATGSDQIILIWKFPKPEPIFILDAQDGPKIHLFFIEYQNQPLLISGDNKGIITLWDFRYSEELYNFQADTKIIQNMVISPNYQALYTNCGDSFIKKWNLNEILETAYQIYNENQSHMVSKDSGINSDNELKKSNKNKYESNPVIKKIMPFVEKVFETFEDQIKDAAADQLDPIKQQIIKAIMVEINGKIPSNIIVNKIIENALPVIVDKLIEKALDKAYEKVQDKMKEFNSHSDSIENKNRTEVPHLSTTVQRIVNPSFSNLTTDQMDLIKKRIRGVLKIKKTIPVDEIAAIIDLDRLWVRNWIYELAGEDKIEGDFEGDIFKFTNDLNQVIEAFIEKIK